MLGKLAVITAHPDDEAKAIGTILKSIRLGYEVSLVWLTRGDRGRPAPVFSHEDVARIRESEAREVAESLGAEYRFLEFRDCEVAATKESRELLIDLIRSLKTEVVLTHSPFERHPDHRATHQLVADASVLACVRGIVGRHAPCPSSAVYCFNINTFRPSHLFIDEGCVYHVDVSNVMEEAASVLRKYRSQLGERFVSYHLNLARKVGKKLGVPYAESFVRLGPLGPRSDLFPELAQGSSGVES